MYCKHCGTKLPDRASTCPNCKASLMPVTRSAAGSYSTKMKGSPRLFPFFGGSGIVGGFLMYYISMQYRPAWAVMVVEEDFTGKTIDAQLLPWNTLAKGGQVLMLISFVLLLVWFGSFVQKRLKAKSDFSRRNRR